MALDFELLLKGSAKKHGHLCPGQAVGVKMAMLGLKLIGLENPKKTRDIKKILCILKWTDVPRTPFHMSPAFL